MKTKTLKQKITLKKQTISNLDNFEMVIVKGGTDDTADPASKLLSCYVCPYTINHGCPPTH
jgi:hypothetical protein